MGGQWYVERYRPEKEKDLYRILRHDASLQCSRGAEGGSFTVIKHVCGIRWKMVVDGLCGSHKVRLQNRGSRITDT